MIGTLQNTGAISSSSNTGVASGVANENGYVLTLSNGGSISGAATNFLAYGIYNALGSITVLTNSGSITGTTYGIENAGGTINTLNNYQGGNSSSASKTALTLRGNLPITYNTFITSKTHYGQLSVTNPVGTMAFDVSVGSNLQRGTYTNVLMGITSSSITGFSGRLNGSSWKLVEFDASNHYWNLVVGPSSDNTLIALRMSSTLVRNVLNSRHSELANTSGYDCETFDKNGMCLSFQARYSSWDNLNDGAGLLIGSYRLTDNIRLGAFADYRLSSSRLTNIKFSDDMPTVGGFIGYSMNTDGTGLNAKVSAAFNTGYVSVTRDSSLANTEAGNGKTRLTSHQVSGEASWALRLSDSSTASPFIGIRQSSASRNGYKENIVTDTVESPITYNDYTQRSVTGTSGLRFKGSVFDQIGYQLALGVEHDINRQFTTYSGTSEIDGLTTFSLTNNGPSKRTRGFGSAGVHYQIQKNQRLTSNISLREQPYSSQLAVSVMSGYQMAF